MLNTLVSLLAVFHLSLERLQEFFGLSGATRIPGLCDSINEADDFRSAYLLVQHGERQDEMRFEDIALVDSS